VEISLGHNFAVTGSNRTFEVSLESASKDASNDIKSVFWNGLCQKKEFEW